jgi:hypothetical protein
VDSQCVSSKSRRKGRKNENTGFIMCFEQEEEIYAVFEHLKDDKQRFFKYFRMSILKSGNFKQLFTQIMERMHVGDIA